MSTQAGAGHGPHEPWSPDATREELEANRRRERAVTAAAVAAAALTVLLLALAGLR